jgi:quinoprotein glucose dehydrogenase
MNSFPARAALGAGISVCVLGLVLAAAGVSSVAAQQAARTTADGVYTEAQAGRGKALYYENCVVCHGDELQGVEGTPGIAGQEFARRWGAKPLSVLFDYINTQMPAGRPGVQGDRGSADIVAFILSFNRLPAGAAELQPDAKTLGEIQVVAKP